jgi:hypothetical protein
LFPASMVAATIAAATNKAMIIATIATSKTF